MCASHPLLDGVIGMLGSFTDNPQGIGRVVEVRRIRMEVAEVVFEEHPILGKALNRLQKEVLQFELTALGLLLKLLEIRVLLCMSAICKLKYIKVGTYTNLYAFLVA